MSLREDSLCVELGHFTFSVLVKVKLNVLVNPDAGSLHLVEGESASLVGADVSRTAHDLASSKLLNVVVVLEHLALRVGEGNHDGEG